jgi:hypothetical protein
MSEPDHPATADVYVVNATSVSTGTGPGFTTLPWDEAKALVDAGYAVWGAQPPIGAGHGPRPVTPP